MQQIGTVFPQEHGICQVGVRHLCRVEEWCLDRIDFHEFEHSCEYNTLQLETALVVRVRKNEENVLDNTQEVLLEERVCNGRLSPGEVVDDFQAHWKPNQTRKT